MTQRPQDNLADDAIKALLTVFKLPEHFRRRLRTSKMCERINR
jgi:hypothetical protein